MNKWYIGIPFIALIAFAIFTFQYKKGYEAKIAEQARIEEQQRQDKLAEERANRLRAIEDATRNANLRKAEAEEAKARREAEEARREEERFALERAKTDQSRLKVEVKDVGEEVEREKRLLQAALEKKQAYEAEREFLMTYVDNARGQKKHFLGLVDKIEEAEKARAAIAAAEAAAASKKR